MSAIDELLKNAESYAASFDEEDPPRQAAKVAVVACMDARLDPHALLGIEEGQAQVIRNAGGSVTEDTIRSLAISQRLLGTEEVMLIHHTDCGMLKFSDDDFRRQLHEDSGVEPEWEPGAFADLEDDLRQSIARVQASPFLPHRHAVRGFVYDVATGRLREV